MENTEKTYANVKIGKPKDAVIEIEGEVSAEILETHRINALAEVRKEINIPGFRKGTAPEKLVLQHIRMDAVLTDAAEAALSEAYPDILHDHKIEPMSSPRVSITKLAQGNPLGFTIRVAVEPEVGLPNYKKITRAAKEKHPAVEVTEKDVEDVVAQLLAMRPAKEGEKAELTDEFVKTLGKFETVAEFKEKLKDNIKEEKTMEARRALYEVFAKDLIAGTELTLPTLLVEDGAEAAHRRFHAELEKRKISEEDYLARIKKTKEEFRKEERETVERQLKTKFVLKAIAAKENIVADEKDIEAEMKHATSHHQNVDLERFRSYISEMLVNEKTLKFLEELK